ncbi:fluoride efflux transporter CrcB [Neobacillus piezotolerans]|uniref:Fluoride-specific ion channel FluC n=1 Tax=Neobacillus piezotolerans TaxID=2259171 RepID=A0A3D8GQN0_9BACI|nr:fluoride efflux transporter CrcB [Neobacillus piezotolerans]RDU36489.1 fluoride efflux transporter CrcB [Neobacillus piezotolerans]
MWLIMVYVFVGIGGAIGSIFRYLLSFLHTPETVIPYGTLAANLSGSFLLGWFTAKSTIFKKLHPQLALAFSTGLLGSYTTFSTFCLEIVKYIEAGQYLYTLAYLVISLAGGILLAWFGYKSALVKLGGVEG